VKIDGPAIHSTSSGALRGAEVDSSRQVERVGIAPAGAAAGQGQADSVSLSELSARLRELNLQEVDWVRRLEQLSADIEAGRYQVDVEAVSERLIGEALQL